MAVEIRRAVLDLVNVDATGGVIDKNSPDTKIRTMLNFTTEFRVFGTGGSASSPNATGVSVDDYLVAEAAEDFQLAHMDQSQIVTQKIT